MTHTVPGLQDDNDDDGDGGYGDGGGGQKRTSFTICSRVYHVQSAFWPLGEYVPGLRVWQTCFFFLFFFAG